MGAPRVIFASPIKPDELYYRIIEAIKENPKLVIIEGNELKRHLDLVVLQREKYYYFELAISHEGKESCIEFTTSKAEHEEQLAKAIAIALPSILEHISHAVQ